LSDENRSRRAGVVLAVAGLVAICALTLFPTGGQPDTPLWCIPCGERATLDALLNIALFVPFSAGLAIAGAPWWLAVLASFGLSFTVEFLQYTVVVGRDPSLRDVVTNTIGGALGAAVGRYRHVIVRPTPREAWQLLGVGSATWVLVHLAGAWLVQPSFTARRIILIPSIDTPIHETFRGRLLAATIAGRVLGGPMESLTPAELAAAQGRDGRVDASAAVIPRGGETGRIAPMVMMVHPPDDIQVALGQLGSTLRFDVRSHAADARLRPLVFEMDRAFPGRAGAIGVDGERLELSAVLEPGRIRMTAESQGRRREWTGRIGAELVWVMLLPFELPVGAVTTVGSLLWLFVTLVPIGYWARSAFATSRDTGRVRWLPLGALWLALGGAVLVAIPAAMHVAYGTAWNWLAMAAGIFAGFVLAPPCSCVAPAGRLRQ
jgi:hypothetical protein